MVDLWSLHGFTELEDVASEAAASAEFFYLDLQQGIQVISWNIHSHVLFLNCEIGQIGSSKNPQNLLSLLLSTLLSWNRHNEDR